MKSITPSLLLLLSLSFLVPAVHAADEPKLCASSAQDCDRHIRQMMAGRRYLGVSVVQLKPGLVVKSVMPDSPAARADFQENDRIMSLNGHDMTNATVEQFKQVLSTAKETGKVWLIVQRRGAFKHLDARLEAYTKDKVDRIVAQHLMQKHQVIAGNSAAPGQR
jgi:C-terminal processing protease CtpA/Prc